MKQFITTFWNIKLISLFFVLFLSNNLLLAQNRDSRVNFLLKERSPNQNAITEILSFTNSNPQQFLTDKDIVKFDSFIGIQMMNYPDLTLLSLSKLYKTPIYKNPHIKCRLELLLATNYFMLSDSENAFHYINKAEINSKLFSNDKLKWRILVAKGNFYGAMCEYYTSLQYYLKALEKDNKDKNSKAIVYHNIAANYLALGRLKDAKIYSLHAIKNLPEFRANYYNQLANIYSELNEYDSAQINYNKILSHGIYKMPLYDLTHFFNHYGVFLIKVKKYDEALNYLLKNEEICLKNNLSHWISTTYANLGEVYLKKDKLDLAQRYLLKSLDSVNYHVGYDTRAKSFFLLSETSRLSNNFKNAFDFYKQYSYYSDFIRSEKIQIEYLNLEAKYKSKLQIQSIKNLEKDKAILTRDKILKDLKLEKAKNFSFYLAALCILLFSLGVASVLFYKQKKAQTETQLRLIEKRKELEKLHAILSGQEIERERISQELHDSVGSDLLVLAMNSNEKEEITRIYNEVRTLSHQLNIPVIDSNMPIAKWSENLVKGIFSETEIKVFFNWHSKDISLFLESGNQQNLYRIMQESFINILKHANAKNVEVQFFIENGNLHLSIIDDGKGFDTNQFMNGFGHKNMLMRTKSLEGKYTVNSNLNSGTTLEFEFPLKIFKINNTKQQSN